MQVLPDILNYDRTKPATYPNGRILTDDVYSARFAWLTKGKVPRRPEAARRPAGPISLPRPAQSLTRSCVRPAREP